jgi:hypothetical protein
MPHSAESRAVSSGGSGSGSGSNWLLVTAGIAIGGAAAAGAAFALASHYLERERAAASAAAGTREHGHVGQLQGRWAAWAYHHYEGIPAVYLDRRRNALSSSCLACKWPATSAMCAFGAQGAITKPHARKPDARPPVLRLAIPPPAAGRTRRAPRRSSSSSSGQPTRSAAPAATGCR